MKKRINRLFCLLITYWISLCGASLLMAQAPLNGSITGKYKFSQEEKEKIMGMTLSIKVNGTQSFEADGTSQSELIMKNVFEIKMLNYTNKIEITHKIVASGVWKQNQVEITERILEGKLKVTFISSSATNKDQISDMLINKMRDTLEKDNSDFAKEAYKESKSKIIKRSISGFVTESIDSKTLTNYSIF